MISFLLPPSADALREAGYVDVSERKTSPRAHGPPRAAHAAAALDVPALPGTEEGAARRSLA